MRWNVIDVQEVPNLGEWKIERSRLFQLTQCHPQELGWNSPELESDLSTVEENEIKSNNPMEGKRIVELHHVKIILIN